MIVMAVVAANQDCLQRDFSWFSSIAQIMYFLEVFWTDVDFLSQIPLLFKYLLTLCIPGCNTVSGFVFIQEEITFYYL